MVAESFLGIMVRLIVCGVGAQACFTNLLTSLMGRNRVVAGARVRVVMTYIVKGGTELCFETMLEKCTIG